MMMKALRDQITTLSGSVHDWLGTRNKDRDPLPSRGEVTGVQSRLQSRSLVTDGHRDFMRYCLLIIDLPPDLTTSIALQASRMNPHKMSTATINLFYNTLSVLQLAILQSRSCCLCIDFHRPDGTGGVEWSWQGHPSAMLCSAGFHCRANRRPMTTPCGGTSAWRSTSVGVSAWPSGLEAWWPGSCGSGTASSSAWRMTCNDGYVRECAT
jgi:hypothetical protein